MRYDPGTYDVLEQIIEALKPYCETRTIALRWFVRQRLRGLDNKTALELVRGWRGDTLVLHIRQLAR